MSLYPNPLIVIRETGCEGLISIFSRMRRMCAIREFSYPYGLSPQAASHKASSVTMRPAFRYEELPTIYIDAVISVEDKRFESHCGVDFIAIGRAVWNDIKARQNLSAYIQIGGQTNG